MKPWIKSLIVILCVAASLCSLLLLGSFFKIGFLETYFSHYVEMHPLALVALILAVLSLMLIFIIFIGRLSGSRTKSTTALLQEIEIRKNVEEKLRESNSFLDIGLENLPDFIFVKDASTLKYIRINSATATFLGKSYDEVFDKSDYDVFSKEESDFVTSKDREVLNAKQPSITYEHLIVKNNTEYWLSTRKIPVFDDDGKPRYIIGISRDITEQKKRRDLIEEFNKDLEKKVEDRTSDLFKSEQRFRSLIENGVDVISMTDKNGVLFYISPSVRKLLGYTDVEMMNKQAGSFIHSHDLDIAANLFQQVLQEPGVPKRSSLRIIHKEGYPVWVEGTIINQLEKENVEAIIANYHDITDRIEVEEQKQTLEAALIEEKIERQKQIAQATLDGQEKERTAIGMEMHDNINQILGVIKLYLGLAKTRPEITMEMVEKSLENIVLCIKETRKLSKSLVTTNISKYGLQFAIQDLIEDFKESGLQFTYDVDENNLLKLDNKVQFSLYRIMQEQFNNIVKHADAKNVAVSIECDGDILRLEITDDGKGFDPTLNHHGIGLSNIQNRVELLNGDFKIVATPNMGCTLQVSVPC